MFWVPRLTRGRVAHSSFFCLSGVTPTADLNGPPDDSSQGGLTDPFPIGRRGFGPTILCLCCFKHKAERFSDFVRLLFLFAQLGNYGEEE